MAQSPTQFSAIKKFRDKLDNGNTPRIPLVGVGVQFTDPMSTDALADSSDFFWFDMEHTPMSPEVLRTHIMIAHGRGNAAFVRIPAPNNNGGNSTIYGTYIKHALDMNADGIIVPQIRTKQDVINIVSDCRYPIIDYNDNIIDKRRGFGPTIPTNYGRLSLDKYLKSANKNVFVAVMIETKEAVQNIKEICSVPGLDCVVIGVMDLSGSLGVAYNGRAKIVQNAVDLIIKTAKENGKYVMFSTRDVDLAKKMVSKGVDIVHCGHDIVQMVTSQTKLYQRLRSKL